MRGKGKSGATTAAKENAVNTVAKKAESTIEAVAWRCLFKLTDNRKTVFF